MRGAHRYAIALSQVEPARRTGSVCAVGPGQVEARGPLARVGDLCEIKARDGRPLLAEVAAVGEDRVVLVPLDQNAQIEPDAEIMLRQARAQAPVGQGFAGRAVDAMAAPIDELGPVLADAFAPLQGEVLAPLERSTAEEMLTTGIRSIDGLLTIARGQRIGLFAASGVGKTTLMTQLALGVECDRCVLCLVGERGGEVEKLWRTIAAREDRHRFTLVAATSDKSAPLRVRAVHQALALAEHWRAKGEHVLLIVDSATRFAMALREIGLSAGAPPTLRAYTPNVFAALPRLVERCGAARRSGAITAVMTVLAETDDVDDPIAEVMKSLLDGHIVLSRTLAEQGHFPAIDVLRSVSRQSAELMSSDHARAAQAMVRLLSTYEDARLMIESGIHKAGANATIDAAIAAREEFLRFLRQSGGERSTPAETLNWLARISMRGARA